MEIIKTKQRWISLDVIVEYGNYYFISSHQQKLLAVAKIINFDNLEYEVELSGEIEQRTISRVIRKNYSGTKFPNLKFTYRQGCNELPYKYSFKVEGI
jgi:hypothetical protein